MDTALLTALAAFVGGAGFSTGGYVAIKKLRPETRKIDADASSTVVEMALQLLQPYRDQMMEQDARLRQVTRRVDMLDAHLTVLEGVIRGLGAEPPERPPFPPPPNQ